MNIYPAIRLNAPEFSHKKIDGRVVSRMEDGTARVQILFDGLQHEFSVLHFLLDKSQRAVVDQFYEDNEALEFYYDCPFNKKRYQCQFTSSPQPTGHVGPRCHLTVGFTGFEVING